MSNIHVARNRQPLGQFDPEEVAAGLQTGKFLPDDLAWRDPMEAWKPLSEFTDLPVVDLSLIPPPLPVELPPVPPADSQPGLPWEPRAGRGFFAALHETVRQIFNTPTAAFRSMRTEGGYGAPLSFYMLLTLPCWWVMLAYTTVAVLLNPAALSEYFPQVPQTTLLANQIASAFLAPFLLAAGAWISAGVFHLIFRLLDATTKPFEATFRAFCYASGPAALFLLIPLCGSLAFFVASQVLTVIAVREAHRMDTLRATLGIVLPSLICSVAVFLLQDKLMALAAQGALR